MLGKLSDRMHVRHNKQTRAALDYLIKHTIGGFELTRFIQKAIIAKAKRMGWDPDA